MGDDKPGGNKRQGQEAVGASKLKSVADMLYEAAKISEQKGAEYGEGYRNHGHVMAGLFPRSVLLYTPDDFARFALIDLIAVKMVRYAANFSKGGHDDS